MSIISTLETILGDTGYPVYPLSIPQGGSVPCYVFQDISSPPIRTFSGNVGTKARIQLSCWGNDYGEAETLAGVASTLLDLNKAEFVFSYKNNEFDDQEEETKLVRKIIEFFITEEL